ncbi:hypothetical protein LZ31DRAFT_554420 [Colletotrichum somersetense]|nr:hypothetical protein LZ31DRAFT_554420 [Colletotrichum somersetense]
MKVSGGEMGGKTDALYSLTYPLTRGSFGCIGDQRNFLRRYILYSPWLCLCLSIDWIMTVDGNSLSTWL